MSSLQSDQSKHCATSASKLKVINLTSLQMLVIKDAHSDSMYHGNWPLLGFKIFGPLRMIFHAFLRWW